MSFPRYPAYKESGVPWLGSIPSHWDVHRLKSLFSLMRREPREEDGIVTAFRDGEVTLRANRRVDGFTNAVQEIGYQGIRHGDLVIHAMDAFAGAIGVSDSDGKSTPVYSVCTPKGPWVDSWYYGLTLRHMALSGFINSLAKGIRERSTEFRWADASVVTLPLPPIEEQVAIKEFIAYETAKIDALVAEQERLIELLKEKRQAVITHVVTKGLDPSVPMKDSGLTWLGEVPAHWRKLPLKRVSPAQTVGIVVNPSDYVSEDGLPFIYGGDISEGLIHFQTARRISAELSQTQPKTRLMAGDLVTVRVGAPGVTAVVTPECEGGNCASVMLIRRGNFNSDWLCFLMNSRIVRFQVEVVQYGAAQEQFNIAHATEFILPVPPVEEQNEIAYALLEVTARIDNLEQEALNAVRLLKERRTALISAAVTGQIDVRQLT